MEKDLNEYPRVLDEDWEAPEGGQESVEPNDVKHGECCEECKRTCRRQFWAEVLRTVAKVAGVVLAALGLSSFGEND